MFTQRQCNMFLNTQHLSVTVNCFPAAILFNAKNSRERSSTNFFSFYILHPASFFRPHPWVQYIFHWWNQNQGTNSKLIIFRKENYYSPNLISVSLRHTKVCFYFSLEKDVNNFPYLSEGQLLVSIYNGWHIHKIRKGTDFTGQKITVKLKMWWEFHTNNKSTGHPPSQKEQSK